MVKATISSTSVRPRCVFFSCSQSSLHDSYWMVTVVLGDWSFSVSSCVLRTVISETETSAAALQRLEGQGQQRAAAVDAARSGHPVERHDGVASVIQSVLGEIDLLPVARPRSPLFHARETQQLGIELDLNRRRAEEVARIVELECHGERRIERHGPGASRTKAGVGSLLRRRAEAARRGPQGGAGDGGLTGAGAVCGWLRAGAVGAARGLLRRRLARHLRQGRSRLDRLVVVAARKSA